MDDAEEPGLYHYSPYNDRPRISWPGGARIAFWVAPNVEFYELDPPRHRVRPSWWRPHPDLVNYSIRDYGNRVGFWRMIEMLDALKIKASISLNVAIFEHFPEIGKAMVDRGYEIFSHGLFNTRYMYDMSEEQELAFIELVKAQVKKHAHQELAGWLSPALSNTPQTMNLLAKAGIKYTLDLLIDDQPQPVLVNEGRLISVPYSLEVNDWTSLHIAGAPPREYTRIIKAQFDRLYQEGARSGTVMCLPLHPWMIGYPHRVEPLCEAIDYIMGHDKVWHCTGREIADWFYAHHYDAFLAHQQRQSRTAA